MSNSISAEIAGTVLQIDRQPGELLEQGDVVLIMESMKMEMPVCAPYKARLVKLLVSEGDPVDEGQPLAVLET
jgi:acetyl-CoA carboxylase biotin carboxyl carrier protein